MSSVPGTKRNWRSADTCASIRKTDWLRILWRPTGTRKLRALADAQQEYEKRREQDHRLFDDEQRSAILALAHDFPRLWKDPATEDRDRKRMIRLLVEDVTMLRGEQIRLHFRFRGGPTGVLCFRTH